MTAHKGTRTRRYLVHDHVVAGRIRRHVKWRGNSPPLTWARALRRARALVKRGRPAVIEAITFAEAADLRKPDTGEMDVIR